MRSERIYAFRYAGDLLDMEEMVVNSRLQRVRNRVKRIPSCPYCGSDMEQKVLSGKRREIREEPYICPDGHRISLIPLQDQDMYMGWK